MMCLFADLSLCSLCRGVSRRLLYSTHKILPEYPYESHCAAGLAVSCPRECSNVCDLYRDSYSNPMAAVLPRRCQPLVTRIAQGLKKMMRPTGEASKPVLAISFAVLFGFRHRPFVIGLAAPPHRASGSGVLLAMQPSRFVSVTGS
jgi:hypothetical protein